MQKWAIIVGVLAAVTLLLMVALITILLWRKITQKSSKEDPKGTTKSLSSNRAYSFQSQRAASKSNVPIENIEGQLKLTNTQNVKFCKLLIAHYLIIFCQKRTREEKKIRFLIVNLHDTDMTAFESERPVIFNLEEIEEATCNFEATKKIGEGGYGSVYFGVLGENVCLLLPISIAATQQWQPIFSSPTLVTNMSKHFPI